MNRLAFTLLAFTCMQFAKADDPTDVAINQENVTEADAMIGLQVEPLHPALTSQLPEAIGKGRGILISHVAAGSPAEKAGLKMHDILVGYGNQRLYSPQQFAKLVRNDTPGRTVKVGYVRHGQEQQVDITLTKKVVTSIPTMVPRFRGPSGPSIDPYMILAEPRKQRWDIFESLTIKQIDDDHFKVTINYTDSDDKTVSQSYEGTRDEIRDAVTSDKALPPSAREPILRALNVTPVYVTPNPYQLPEILQQQLLDWPQDRRI